MERGGFLNFRALFPLPERLRDELINYKNYTLGQFMALGPFYALISTSTPLGRSSLLNASTVREEEV